MKIARFEQHGVARPGIIDKDDQLRAIGALIPDVTSATIGSNQWRE